MLFILCQETAYQKSERGELLDKKCRFLPEGHDVNHAMLQCLWVVRLNPGLARKMLNGCAMIETQCISLNSTHFKLSSIKKLSWES
jgi:hypothetical protein